MKNTKRFIAMTAALTLTACMAMPMASFAGPNEITINTSSETVGTHTYTAYRIFNGSASASGATSLGDPTWAGTGTKSMANFISALQANTAFGATGSNDFDGVTTVAQLVSVLSTYTSNPAKAKAFAKVCAEGAGASDYGFPSVAEDSSGKIPVTEDGYYVIKEAFSADTNGSGSETAYLLGVYDAATGATIDAKSSVPSVVKKVQDINDSAASPELSGLIDSADYDIGDVIPYTITATIGAGIENFDSYSLEFDDTMSTGLSIKNASKTAAEGDYGWKVMLGSKDITNSFSYEATSPDGNGNITHKWKITDLKDGNTLAENDTVTLTYYATLNSNAVVGQNGNPNTVVLKYDNNPNNCGGGNPQGTTPQDKNMVFTYKTVFTKVKEDGTTALTGADFKLEKKTGTDTWTDVTSLGDTTNHPTKTGDTSGSVFEFSGLDDGTYRLTEITTPAGYNTMTPIVFNITATHDENSANPSLLTLTGTDGSSFTMTQNSENDGVLEADVVNTKGSSLPSTGGIGTTLFILGGGCAAGIAGIYLVSKKKTRDEE